MPKPGARVAESITPYHHNVLERRQKQAARLAVRQERAWDIARQAAVILREEFGCSRVVVFGSLLTPTLFHVHSDVDLMVWGLEGRAYYHAVGRLQGLDREIAVDVIAFEDASPGLRDMATAEGKDL